MDLKIKHKSDFVPYIHSYSNLDQNPWQRHALHSSALTLKVLFLKGYFIVFNVPLVKCTEYTVIIYKKCSSINESSNWWQLKTCSSINCRLLFVFGRFFVRILENLKHLTLSFFWVLIHIFHPILYQEKIIKLRLGESSFNELIGRLSLDTFL